MSLRKNISGGDLDVSVPGFQRLVEDGETIDAPDYQPGHAPGEVPDDLVMPIAWPENRWQLVQPPRVKPEKAAKTDG